MKTTKEFSGLEELIVRVDRIARECGGLRAEDGKSRDEIKDEFLKAKTSIYANIGEARDLIRERRKLQCSRGTCHEVIRKGVRISDLLKALDRDFGKLSQVYRSQSAKKKKWGEAELESRLQDVDVIKRLIEETKASQKGDHDLDAGCLQTLTDRRARPLSSLPPPSQETSGVSRQQKSAVAWRETACNRVFEEMSQLNAARQQEEEPLSAEDQETIQRWKKRDGEMDNELKDISEALDGLQHIAVRIGETAEKHQIMTEEVAINVDQARANLTALTRRLKRLIKEDRSSTFCIRVTLGFVLLIMGAYFYAEVTNANIKWPWLSDDLAVAETAMA